MKNYFPRILLLACISALAAGVVRLFDLRFEVGDVYPPYSSLRSDPVGTMALFESLGRLPGVAVTRDFSTADRLPDARATTYIHAAATVDEWQRMSPAILDEIEKFVTRGGRFVITMTPVTFRSRRPQTFDFQTVHDRLHVDFKAAALDRRPDGSDKPVLVRNDGGLPVPETLEWHSSGLLSNVGGEWTSVYKRNTDPVMVERAIGDGTLVIATDSYFLSNEAMQKNRHADLLSWLIGPASNVVFDEAHLGVIEQAGVATLMRKYRLEGFFVSLLVLSALFIWKSSFSFVPPRAEETGAAAVIGKSASEGFDNLLRRSIRTSDVLDACFAEWQKSAAQYGRYSAGRIREAEAEFARENSLREKDRNPVRAYQEVSRILRAQIK